MAKKRQFKGAKYKDGILSYNYLGEKGGKGGGDVSIKKQGEDWYFVDDDGKIRTDVGDGGKLTPTHMQNLRDDGIFNAVKVNPDTGGEYAKETEIVSTSGDGVGITSEGTLSDGTASVQSVPLAETNVTLPKKKTTELPTTAPAQDYPISTSSDTMFSPKNEYTNVSRGNMPTGYTTGRPTGGKTAYERGEIGSGYSENTPYIPETVSLPPETMIEVSGPETVNASNVIVPTDPNSGNFTSHPRFDNSPSLNMQNNADSVNISGATGGFSPPPYAINENSPQTNYPISTSPDTAFSPANEYTLPQATNMTSNYTTGWSPGVGSSGAPVDVMQEGTTTPGIVDQKDDSPWGTAAGWNAAGSVMKGVGGLYGAWTGMKNYQLARDAHATQKNQWQANYNQRLKAYEDNKTMANQEIDARNRVLAARGVAEGDRIQHI